MTISENLFNENISNWEMVREGNGAGMDISDARVLEISKNTFTANKAGGHGGAIHAQSLIGEAKSDPYEEMPEEMQGKCTQIIVNGNIFRQNIAREHAAAAFLGNFHTYCRIFAVNNLVVENTATVVPSGGFTIAGHAAYLLNCTFKGNISPSTGHSISFDYIPAYFVTLRMVNCIVHNGDDPPTSGLVSADSPTILYSDIQGIDPNTELHIINDNPRYSDNYGRLWPYGAGGDQDPSPCIDAGTQYVDDPDTTGEGWVETLASIDVRGNDRILAGQSGGSQIVDMGAFEMMTYTQQEEHIWPVPGDADWNCTINILDLIVIRNLLNQSPSVGTNWKKDVNQDGKINILDLIYVRNHLGLHCD